MMKDEITAKEILQTGKLIPVTLALPPVGKRVITYNSYKNETSVGKITEYHYNSKANVTNPIWTSEDEVWTITHWLPIPT